MVNRIQHSTASSSLGDILEKVLDKGIVVAGDISISIADIELLSIRIRLVIASVEKAMEMGIDWWITDPSLSSVAQNKRDAPNVINDIHNRLQKIENKLE